MFYKKVDVCEIYSVVTKPAKWHIPPRYEDFTARERFCLSLLSACAHSNTQSTTGVSPTFVVYVCTHGLQPSLHTSLLHPVLEHHGNSWLHHMQHRGKHTDLQRLTLREAMLGCCNSESKSISRMNASRCDEVTWSSNIFTATCSNDSFAYKCHLNMSVEHTMSRG